MSRGQPSIVVDGERYVAESKAHSSELEQRIEVAGKFLDRVATLVRDRADRPMIARRLDAVRAVLRGGPVADCEAAFCPEVEALVHEAHGRPGNGHSGQR